MKKEEFIKRYGEEAYEKWLQQGRDWYKANPESIEAKNQEIHRKGGKYYGYMLEYKRTGLQGGRNRIRAKHARLYRAIKQATPNSVLHHEWMPGTSNYRGVALVEEEAHQNGIIKAIKVLEGQITLFTEKEIKE